VNADTARQWGLFTADGQQAAQADSVVAVEIALEARISDYPVEKGGFGSYNKVQVPYDVRLIMARGGSVEDRQDFLKAMQKAWQSTDLYQIITPESVYLDVNVVTLRRMAAGDRGATLMTLEIGLRKVRETAKLTFTDTKEPAGSGVVQDGSVQAAGSTQTQSFAGTAK
jgi:hypothetical protein